QDLRLIANVTPEFLHEDFDLGERHAGPASYLYEHVCCVCQHPSTIHQRIFQRLRERVMRAIVRIGFAVGKQATAIAGAQSGEQVIEADANESRPLDKVHNRSHALADGHIRHCESLMNSRLRRGQIAHSIVFETDYRVGKLAEPGQRLARLRVATELVSECTSVLMATTSALSNPSSTMRSSAFKPAPPTLTTLIGTNSARRSGRL